jgi:sigma-54 dependent transcriptional regulator, acetoin dehydrogenase operon transcriptional activator AcoR
MEKRKEMKALWKKFVATGMLDGREIRPDILESWKRCRERNVYPYYKTCPIILSSNELKKKLDENRDLIDIARPVIENIYQFVAGSGFVVMLCDKDAYILERIGDPDRMDSMAAQAGFVEGACCSEEIIGTNAIGTCILRDKPIQVHAYEHWTSCTHVGTCSAAPIHDPISKKIVGALDMTGPWEKVQPHTLGMVVAGAGAIESLIESRYHYKKAVMADQHKALIMEFTSDGLITVDNRGVITHINGQAMKYLGLNENPTGSDTDTVFKSSLNRREIYRELLRWIETRDNISDEFLNIHLPSGLFRCMGSAHSLLENGKLVGRLLILQDITRIHRLVNKVISKQATAHFTDLVSHNREFLESIDMAIHAAKTNANILLLGESGTGKELFAQAVHNASDRANQPFVAINCGAIPRDLLSSELFGYASGAFTGAQKGGASGKFEMADGGTVFLDEIGDMPLEMQAALLRVIQERIIMRIGSSKPIPVDVRIVAATNKDLAKEVDSKKFRFDLYYRLNVISINLPALRDRKEDIPALIEKIVDRIATHLGKWIQKIEPAFVESCMLYHWPGNIRELNNIIERAIILTKNNTLSAIHFPSHLLLPSHQETRISSRTSGMGNPILKKSNRDTEKIIIVRHLEECKYNKSIAAERLGISRSTLYRKMKELDLAEWL